MSPEQLKRESPRDKWLKEAIKDEEVRVHLSNLKRSMNNYKCDLWDVVCFWPIHELRFENKGRHQNFFVKIDYINEQFVVIFMCVASYHDRIPEEIDLFDFVVGFFLFHRVIFGI